MTPRTALKVSALGTLDSMVDRRMWRDIGNGLLAVVLLVVRLLILLAFPVSTPLIAWLIVMDERKTARDRAAIERRLRDGIHRNGPPA